MKSNSRKYEKLPNIVIHACKNITEKMNQLKMCGPQVCLFIYVSTHCVKTVKQLDYNPYSQLTHCGSGNAFALGARGSGFDSRLQQGSLCLIFCFVVVQLFYFLFKNTLFVTTFCNSLCNVNLFSILNLFQDLFVNDYKGIKIQIENLVST